MGNIKKIYTHKLNNGNTTIHLHFSGNEKDAVIICADENHVNDFVGLKVVDTHADEWVQVKGFEITIKG